MGASQDHQAYRRFLPLLAVFLMFLAPSECCSRGKTPRKPP
jgi:hypothetical protein